MSHPESGNSNGTQQSSTADNGTNDMLKQTQADVVEVTGIIRVGLGKILERGEKLSELDNRAEVLSQNASKFYNDARKLMRKHWWADKMITIVMGMIGLVLLTIIILF